MEKNLIKKQLNRAKEFASISQNSTINENFISSIANKWEIQLDE